MVAPNIRQVADDNGPQSWFLTLPILTQYWFGLTLLVTVAVNTGIITPYSITLDWESIKNKFEIWRFLTCFCYAGPFAFPTLMSIYMLVNFSRQYESSTPYNTGAGGGTADYAFMLIIGFICIAVAKPITDLVWPTGIILTKNLVSFVFYIWSKKHPDANGNIWGIPVKGAMLPFAYLAFDIFIGNPYYAMIHGYAMGHIYYFMVEVVPNVYGVDIVRTPQFLIDCFGVGEYRPAAAAVAPVDDADARRHTWGNGGNRLGGQAPPAPPPAHTASARGNVARQDPPRAPTGGHTWGTGGHRLGGS